MIRRFALLLLLLVPFVMTGCSDGNSSAPPSTQAHPFDWYTAHRPAATASPEFVDCTGCHGADLMGSGGAPSCFSASFDGRSCHAGGPVPHPMDGTFLTGSVHGPEAKADLTFCQTCHSDNPTGGPGSNPRFNVGIDSQGSIGCEACHGVNYAHPAAWAGPNSTFHYSAGNIQNACTLCHGANLAGGVGVSCLGCHSSTTTFALDCTACHETPPGATETVDHGGVSAITSHDVCTVCHGMKETGTGGAFSAVANYTLFDKTTDTQGDHWDGNINMNSATGYNETTFGCDTALCHGNDLAHQLSDSGLPVVTADFGGANVPHPVDGSFLSPANHGPAVKAQTAAFPNGLLDCQLCHAEAGTDNPRFNVGINSASGTGCESLACHPTNMAHPANWYDLGSKHSDIAVANLTAMCVLCHDTATGGPVSGGVGPACVTCHPADPLANPSGCASCHNLPPDGAGVAGNVRPNRQGSHDAHQGFTTCATCHNGVGFNTAAHFDQTEPANVVFSAGGTYDSATTPNCTNLVGCHGDRTW